jgi:hypothetical protein
MAFPKGPVVLSLAAGETTVPVQGTIVSESKNYFRFRMGTVEIDIWKTMVRAIRRDPGSPYVN